MHGIVVFYYLWMNDLGKGEVRFLLTGQNCNGCNTSDFQTPMWYPEEAQKVIFIIEFTFLEVIELISYKNYQI